MRKMNQRNAERMMRQMGMKLDEIGDVTEVILRLPDKELVIENPSVSVIDMQGQRIYQIIGGKPIERFLKSKEEVAPKIKEEDVLLVAQQANVTPDQARSALQETNGDLAQSIILLKTR
jgi:nascent polypeptide-associated complex subunit alpha